MATNNKLSSDYRTKLITNFVRLIMISNLNSKKYFTIFRPADFEISYSILDLKYFLKITGTKDTNEKTNNSAIELQLNAILELVIL